MTKTELLKQLATDTGLRKKEVENVLQALRTTIQKTMKKEGKIKLEGLGVFQLKDRKARIGRNPATGQEIKIPAKKVVKFRVAKAAKDAILGVKK